MKTLSETLKNYPLLMQRQAIDIIQDLTNHTIKYFFKDGSSIKIKIS